MIVYPAIDIRQGKVVRLMHGDPDQQSVYSDDPIETALKWKAAGARWLHVVSLDGALGEDAPAIAVIRDLAELGLGIQFGGGLRSLEHAEQALQAGATRIILGTLVVQNPELARVAVEQFGTEAVVVALDAKGDKVATEGWQSTSEWSPIELGKRFAEDGVRHALYTDITKDGDLSGVNVVATVELAQQTELQVIASGGVSTIHDITRLKQTKQVAGVVVGRALYTGVLTLAEALKAAIP